MSSKSTTKFTSRGRLAGLVRDEIGVGAGPNRANRAAQRGPGQLGPVPTPISSRIRPASLPLEVNLVVPFELIASPF